MTYARLVQPWEPEGFTKDEFREWAEKSKAKDARLIRETLVGGYRDDAGDLCADYLRWTDVNTSEIIAEYDPSEEDAPRLRVIMVERDIVYAA